MYVYSFRVYPNVYYTHRSTPCSFHVITHLGGCPVSVHRESLHSFLHVPNTTWYRSTLIYLTNLYSQCLVIRNRATVNDLKGAIRQTHRHICPLLPFPLSPPSAPTPSGGAEEGGGSWSWRTVSRKQKAEGRMPVLSEGPGVWGVKRSWSRQSQEL